MSNPRHPRVTAGTWSGDPETQPTSRVTERRNAQRYRLEPAATIRWPGTDGIRHEAHGTVCDLSLCGALWGNRSDPRFGDALIFLAISDDGQRIDIVGFRSAVTAADTDGIILCNLDSRHVDDNVTVGVLVTRHHLFPQGWPKWVPSIFQSRRLLQLLPSRHPSKPHSPNWVSR